MGALHRDVRPHHLLLAVDLEPSSAGNARAATALSAPLLSPPHPAPAGPSASGAQAQAGSPYATPPPTRQLQSQLRLRLTGFCSCAPLHTPGVAYHGLITAPLHPASSSSASVASGGSANAPSVDSLMASSASELAFLGGLPHKGRGEREGAELSGHLLYTAPEARASSDGMIT